MLKAREIQAQLSAYPKRAILVLGSGVTGRATADFFITHGRKVCVIDENPISSERRRKFEDAGIQLRDSIETPLTVSSDSFALCVRSPGISLSGDLSKGVQAAGIPVVSESALAFSYLPAPDIAVTGTNGKTTTVHLIAKMVEFGGREPLLLGNVGTPFISAVSHAPETGMLVCELSSYQLEDMVDFSPRVSACLNIDEDHLERHGTLEKYIQAKANIFGDGWAVLPGGTRWTETLLRYARGKILLFGEHKHADAGGHVFLTSGRTEIVFSTEDTEEHYSLRDFQLLGLHNKLNASAAVALARLAGVKREAVQEALSTFTPLPHRLERIISPSGVVFINDSKATNVSAACAAIAAVKESYPPEQKIVLLVGGKAKQGGWESLRKNLDTQVKAVIGFGGDGKDILRELNLTQAIEEYHTTLEEAVHAAKALTSSSDIILLAPGAASQDAYPNYEARGEHFRALAEE